MATIDPTVTQPLQPIADDKNLLATPQQGSSCCGGSACGGN
ncbi:hypothetical protein NQ166_06300 [Microbacterium sp. zg.Y1090]|nr:MULTISPECIES: hypothetical protein [unclassified Microbacterium]MCR2812113.1 hypothetical protein [Microbacterium sp. zg.Y1084]MCR2818449.1 hypothetical protein [Microbacterium sp. zg.Y1090]MDL5486262.1 hypothetical protein [Microbacterium sp. zg-Y1211]WIM29460.1 hypothetical protein QNO26_06110 [Microbacterium sp. zg-Y1090]